MKRNVPYSIVLTLKILLLASVIATDSFGASRSNCTGALGNILDTIGDAQSAETDFGQFSWSISGNVVTFTMDMPNLSQPIPVNRDGINPGYKEYEWGIYIDADNDPFTGTSSTGLAEGADYRISISYWHSFNTSNFLNINQMQWDLWEYSEHSGVWSSVATPTLSAPSSETYYQMTSSVPGLTTQSKLMPFTFYAAPFTGFLYPDTHPDCRLENLDRIFTDDFS